MPHLWRSLFINHYLDMVYNLPNIVPSLWDYVRVTFRHASVMVSPRKNKVIRTPRENNLPQKLHNGVLERVTEISHIPNVQIPDVIGGEPRRGDRIQPEVLTPGIIALVNKPYWNPEAGRRGAQRATRGDTKNIPWRAICGEYITPRRTMPASPTGFGVSNTLYGCIT